MDRVHLIIKGTVQGVGFRQSTRMQANQLGLTGYVKNLPNGDVEIVAEGPSQAVNELLEWAKQGPPTAQVKQVDIDYKEVNGEFGDFSVKH